MIKYKTPLLVTDKVNLNKRIYPKDIVQDALNNEYFIERLNNETLFGEAGQPIEKDNPIRISYIDVPRISHLINNIWWEDNILMGEVQTVNTSLGKDLEKFIEQGGKPEFALRGAGNLQYMGENTYKVSDLHILSFDWILKSSNNDLLLIKKIIAEKSYV